MSKTKTLLKRAGFGLLAIVVLLGGGGGFYFKSYLPNTVAPKSFPQIDGGVQLTGLDGLVDIYRDSMGIPHIYATTQHDLFYAQGYVHAQDRFWQMDAWRHIGAGRVAEMFPSQVDTDMFLRTLNWAGIAKQEYEMYDTEEKATLQAYADGVNAYIKDRNPEEVSLEYSILKLLNPDYKIEPWTPINSITMGKVMAWDLGSNLDDEISRALLLKSLSPEQVADLFPQYADDLPVIIPSSDGKTTISRFQNTGSPKEVNAPVELLIAAQNKFSLLDSLLGPRGPEVGSNSWAISGDLTATGKPLIANDMHLSIQMPSIWYQNSLHCLPKTKTCPIDVTGFTFTSVPGVVAGHNDKIAWAFTNLSADVQDLFIEKINPDNPNQYEYEGKWVDFETRTETIYAGGKDPATITVRISRHGPIISEVYGRVTDIVAEGETPFKDRAGLNLPEHYAIAFQWTGLQPNQIYRGVWGFNKAQNWDEFQQAAREWVVPTQNLLYADTEGNIGIQMPGMIPIRKNGDGSVPVPGWTGEYEWTGFIPFEELPYAVNPPEGYIVTANNQTTPRDYPYFVTSSWDYGFRADRIVDMIKQAPGKIDIAYFQKMHFDSLDPLAAVYIPLLQNMNAESGSPNQAMAMDMLKSWDGQALANSAPAAVFEAFRLHLIENTFKDDVSQEMWEKPPTKGMWRSATVAGVLRELANDLNNSWWDDKTTTDKVENRDDILLKSFVDGVVEQEKAQGSDVTKWRWGHMHTATFVNQTLGMSGISLIEDLFNRGPYEVSGGSGIVNATSWAANHGYASEWVPSEREIVDLSNLNNSITVHTTGQSGHAYHTHYDDMTLLWVEGKYYPMLWDQKQVMSQAEGHLMLTPK